MTATNYPPGVSGGEWQITGEDDDMCSREDDPTQHDDRRVLRPGGCQHPGITDAEVLAYHDSPSGLRQPLVCLEMRTVGSRTWECGQWFTVSTLDDDVVLVDEPAGAGA